MNVLREFQQTGNDLFFGGLNNSHSGNMSVRIGGMMAITRTGSMLHRLGHGDIIETSIANEDSQTPLASREYPVHKAIYQATDSMAIVHAHPPHVIALSLVADRLVPLDAEGKYYYPQGIPVVAVQNAVASLEVAAAVAPLLRTFPIVAVRGHGTFAVGKDLESGLHWTSSLDNVAQIIILNKHYTGCSKFSA